MGVRRNGQIVQKTSKGNRKKRFLEKGFHELEEKHRLNLFIELVLEL